MHSSDPGRKRLNNCKKNQNIIMDTKPLQGQDLHLPTKMHINLRSKLFKRSWIQLLVEFVDNPEISIMHPISDH